MPDYSCEAVGYFSVIDGQLTEPVFKSLDVEKINRINHDGVELDGSIRVPVAKNTDTVNHLLAFLEKKDFLNRELGAKKFNFISRATTLRRLLAVYPNHKETPYFKFYKYLNKNTTVLEQEYSMEHFCSGMFSDFLKNQKSIKFYGTIEELEKVKNHMTEEQLEMLEFVENDD